ncbi:DNA oxidative demethylase AlkB [Paucibacter sp. KBW04]|uniref:DNA oxidative demethylase AlkB n=1 Tax=Paucibacter sp. KBW04 TaxID=2153361 RepID=UPI000F56FBC5|nr:DNA oxidative demethylase AlkB [Paucibacter sp. KBW04]RQO62478.1 DNA oxidative demethylase AlkB [Paucibacter sp. KBW04]
MNASLFDDEPAEMPLAPGATMLRGFALAHSAALQAGVAAVLAQAPLRQMLTPGGKLMAVWMTNCGPLGWVSDRRGYRYQAQDPVSGRPWPALPAAFAELAQQAAERAGFPRFEPDACLINRYLPGTRLSLHQDRDEQDFSQPIVSVSLGLPAVFLFGGLSRGDKTERLDLQHGDVLVWGGPARLRFHGVMPLAGGRHEELGEQRINLTFRKAG